MTSLTRALEAVDQCCIQGIERLMGITPESFKAFSQYQSFESMSPSKTQKPYKMLSIKISTPCSVSGSFSPVSDEESCMHNLSFDQSQFSDEEDDEEYFEWVSKGALVGIPSSRYRKENNTSSTLLLDYSHFKKRGEPTTSSGSNGDSQEKSTPSENSEGGDSKESTSSGGNQDEPSTSSEPSGEQMNEPSTSSGPETSGQNTADQESSSSSRGQESGSSSVGALQQASPSISPDGTEGPGPAPIAPNRHSSHDDPNRVSSNPSTTSKADSEGNPKELRPDRPHRGVLHHENSRSSIMSGPAERENLDHEEIVPVEEEQQPHQEEVDAAPEPEQEIEEEQQEVAAPEVNVPEQNLAEGRPRILLRIRYDQDRGLHIVHVEPVQHEVVPDEHEVIPDEHDVVPDEHEVVPDEHEEVPHEHEEEQAGEESDESTEEEEPHDGAPQDAAVVVSDDEGSDASYDSEEHSDDMGVEIIPPQPGESSEDDDDELAIEQVDPSHPDPSVNPRKRRRDDDDDDRGGFAGQGPAKRPFF